MITSRVLLGRAYNFFSEHTHISLLTTYLGMELLDHRVRNFSKYHQQMIQCDCRIFTPVNTDSHFHISHLCGGASQCGRVHILFWWIMKLMITFLHFLYWAFIFKFIFYYLTLLSLGLFVLFFSIWLRRNIGAFLFNLF